MLFEQIGEAPSAQRLSPGVDEHLGSSASWRAWSIRASPVEFNLNDRASVDEALTLAGQIRLGG